MSSNSSGFIPLRPLLSRTRDEERASTKSPESNAARKRDVVVAACEDCRKRKAKTRGSALKRKHEYLDREFQELQKSHDSLQQLVQALQSRNEKDALAIFRRIRQHEDAETILEHLHASDLLLELQTGSNSRLAGGPGPGPGSRSDSRSTTHQALIPYSLLTCDYSCSSSPPSSSLYFPLVSQGQSQGQCHEDEVIQIVPRQHPNQEVRFSPFLGLLPCISNAFHYTKPHALVKVLDSRLDSVVPSRWTRVPADDGVLRDLLGRYFAQEYVRIACFHKDQFLEDMVSGSMQCCSPLLVNAVLALSCYCHHEAVDELKSRQLRCLGYECLAQAKSLWDLELGNPIRITTIQATMVLSVTMNVCSAEDLGIKYARAAVAMAVDQGLFLSSLDARRVNRRLQQAHEFTAWCLHNWIILQGYQFVISTTTLSTPRLPPLPDPEEDPDWYGQVWMQELSTLATPTTKFCLDHARLFRARCEILSIFNQVACHFSRPSLNEGSNGGVL
ncbi:hypothetical protein E4U21_001719 [Claviceps maximensis]|nr:hypothetical protein E4U21_001719 [Claviceps maximensis]